VPAARRAGGADSAPWPVPRHPGYRQAML